MVSLIKEKVNLLALAFCGVCAAFWISVLIEKYYSISLYGESWDMALYTQVLWGLSHGKFFSSILGSNFIAEHCHFWSFFLAPAYRFFPNPLILPYLKVGGFFVGAYIFFLILKKNFHPLIAFGGMIAFIFAPANVAMLRFFFTYETFSIPLVFLIFWAMQEKRYWVYVTSCVFLVLLKEQMPFVVFMFGVLAFFVKKEDWLRWGLVPLLLGSMSFIGENFILVLQDRQQTQVSSSVEVKPIRSFGYAANQQARQQTQVIAPVEATGVRSFDYATKQQARQQTQVIAPVEATGIRSFDYAANQQAEQQTQVSAPVEVKPVRSFDYATNQQARQQAQVSVSVETKRVSAVGQVPNQHVGPKKYVYASTFWKRYSKFGQTPEQILLSLFMHPLNTLTQFFSPQNFKWYRELFGAWGWFVFWSPLIFLPSLPLFLKTILSSNNSERVVSAFYYAATFMPFIYLAFFHSLNYIWGRRRFMITLFITAGIAFLNISAVIQQSLSQRIRPSLDANTLALARFINKIPASASVLSCWRGLPYLANRERVYVVRNYLTGENFLIGGKFNLPEDTEYLLLDFSEPLERVKPLRMRALNFSSNWRLQESIEDVALFVKNPDRREALRLIEKSAQPFSQNNTMKWQVFDKLGLLDLKFPHIISGKVRVFPVTMDWQCLAPSKIDFEVLVRVTSGGQLLYSKRKPIGASIYPVKSWQEGEYVRETYYYLLPQLPQGQYALEVSFYNSKKSSSGHGEQSIKKDTFLFNVVDSQ